MDNKGSKETVEVSDEATAIALREAGLPVSAEISETEAMQKYIFQMQAAVRKEALANEKQLKGLYVDWVFKSLNLTSHR